MLKKISFAKLIKYELINILRSRWLVAFTLIVAAMSYGFLKISGDTHKAIVSLSSVSIVFIPLISSIFAALYWYYNEQFTQLILTFPIPRINLYWSRFLALSSAVTASYALGTLLCFVFFGEINISLLIMIIASAALIFIFTAMALLFSIWINDRMKGVGAIFGIWLYLVLVHDGFLLLALIAWKDYPLDISGGIAGILNPIGLARVVLLMHNEASLLLGHTGALARNILTSWVGYAIAGGVSILWVVIPIVLGIHFFKKKDF